MCTRRHFVKAAAMSALLGPALLEQSAMAAARARAANAVSPSTSDLFNIQQITDGVYAAIAKPQLFINSNACIIVNEDDVMVVDAHSKPSAAKALIAQIARDITTRPVRYLVNTHFHWDHVQGNHAYAQTFPTLDIYASQATKDLIHENARQRLTASLETVPKQLEDLRQKLEQVTSPEDIAKIKDLIAQGEAYLAEMKDVNIDLPTKTFSDTLVITKKTREIHLSLIGLAHTSGDVVVHLPAEKVVATGDMVHGFLPFIADGYPQTWPVTLDKLKRIDFTYVSPGHGGVQQGKGTITSFRNYIEELTGRVEAGKKAGKSVEELKAQITVVSLRSLQSNGYAEQLRKTYAKAVPQYPGSGPDVENGLKSNIAEIYGKVKTA